MSRIEQLISDIESYIDNCKFQPLSNTKIIVNKEQLEDMLAELRLKTPEEVKKYQKILNNKDLWGERGCGSLSGREPAQV